MIKCGSKYAALRDDTNKRDFREGAEIHLTKLKRGHRERKWHALMETV